MKFTTPCFVRVEDAEKRKELAVWLSSIGRYVSPAVTSSDYHKDWVIVTEPYDPDLDGYVGIWAKTPKSPAFIDCGENIELFKAPGVRIVCTKIEIQTLLILLLAARPRSQRLSNISKRVKNNTIWLTLLQSL